MGSGERRVETAILTIELYTNSNGYCLPRYLQAHQVWWKVHSHFNSWYVLVDDCDGTALVGRGRKES